MTRSDTLHPALFIEVKLRAKSAAVSLWTDTAIKAAKENKTPLVALTEKGRPGYWMVLYSRDLKKILKHYLDSMEAKDNETRAEEISQKIIEQANKAIDSEA